MTDYTKASDAQVETPEAVNLLTFPARSHTPVIEWEYPEFQSLCPVSERHDQGILVLQYQPRDKILESKSVRDYLILWRNKKNCRSISPKKLPVYYMRPVSPPG